MDVIASPTSGFPEKVRRRQAAFVTKLTPRRRAWTGSAAMLRVRWKPSGRTRGTAMIMDRGARHRVPCRRVRTGLSPSSRPKPTGRCPEPPPSLGAALAGPVTGSQQWRPQTLLPNPASMVSTPRLARLHPAGPRPVCSMSRPNPYPECDHPAMPCHGPRSRGDGSTPDTCLPVALKVVRWNSGSP